MLSANRPELQVADRVEQLDELLVALGDRRAELGAVDVEVVEQSLQVILAGGPDRRAFDVAGTPGSSVSFRFSSCRGPLADVGEQVAREDVEALLRDRLPASELGVACR